MLPSLLVFVRSAQRSVFQNLMVAVRSVDRRRCTTSCLRGVHLSSLLVLVLLVLGCSRGNTTVLPQQEHLPAGKPEQSSTAPSQSELPTTSAEELEAKLAPIRAEASSELRLEKRAPDDLAAYLAELDGKLFDLLLDDGIDESALKELKNLPSLFHLRVRQTALGDEALGSIIQNHPELQILNLPQAAFTQAGIQQLNQFTKLKQLRLGGSWIDDAIVAEIAKLPKLQHLHLIQPRLSAASLESLADSAKLTSLYIDDCDLPDSAWKKLFDAKPQLHVHIDQQHHDRDPGADGH